MLRTILFFFFIALEAMKIRDIKTGKGNPIYAIVSPTIIDCIYYSFLLSNIFAGRGFLMTACSLIILLMGLFSFKTKATPNACLKDSIITIILLLVAQI